MKLAIVFSILVAAFGLLFYWRNRSKRSVSLKNLQQEQPMSYGLEWTDRAGRTITEDSRPLMLLGSVSLTANDVGKDVKAQFNTGGLQPYWVPVVRTGTNALGSLMLNKAQLSLNEHQATYTFRVTKTHLGEPNDASLTIYYGVI